ncbi:thiamine phosphate synthase [Priestia megaterium]|nr:thiamine phosphate synthase [Priestia megaterium]
MRSISRTDMKQLLKAYFIMGSNNCRKDPREVLKEAIEGGITIFQFREKGEGALTGQAKYNLAKELQEICKQHGIPFIVNDDLELAILLEADGVHIGQDDEKAHIVREKIGNKMVGVSVHTTEELEQAIQDGADYVGMGPVFPTTTKKDAKEVQGTKLIEVVRKKGIDFPIVGIGGITPDNAHTVIQAGADGVSVITAISLADSPKESTEKLLEKVTKA